MGVLQGKYDDDPPHEPPDPEMPARLARWRTWEEGVKSRLSVAITEHRALNPRSRESREAAGRCYDIIRELASGPPKETK